MDIEFDVPPPPENGVVKHSKRAGKKVKSKGAKGAPGKQQARKPVNRRAGTPLKSGAVKTMWDRNGREFWRRSFSVHVVNLVTSTDDLFKAIAELGDWKEKDAYSEKVPALTYFDEKQSVQTVGSRLYAGWQNEIYLFSARSSRSYPSNWEVLNFGITNIKDATVTQLAVCDYACEVGPYLTPSNITSALRRIFQKAREHWNLPNPSFVTGTASYLDRGFDGARAGSVVKGVQLQKPLIVGQKGKGAKKQASAKKVNNSDKKSIAGSKAAKPSKKKNQATAAPNQLQASTQVGNADRPAHPGGSEASVTPKKPIAAGNKVTVTKKQIFDVLGKKDYEELKVIANQPGVARGVVKKWVKAYFMDKGTEGTKKAISDAVKVNGMIYPKDKADK